MGTVVSTLFEWRSEFSMIPSSTHFQATSSSSTPLSRVGREVKNSAPAIELRRASPTRAPGLSTLRRSTAQQCPDDPHVCTSTLPERTSTAAGAAVLTRPSSPLPPAPVSMLPATPLSSLPPRYTVPQLPPPPRSRSLTPTASTRLPAGAVGHAAGTPPRTTVALLDGEVVPERGRESPRQPVSTATTPAEKEAVGWVARGTAQKRRRQRQRLWKRQGGLPNAEGVYSVVPSLVLHQKQQQRTVSLGEGAAAAVYFEWNPRADGVVEEAEDPECGGDLPLQTVGPLDCVDVYGYLDATGETSSGYPWPWRSPRYRHPMNQFLSVEALWLKYVFPHRFASTRRGSPMDPTVTDTRSTSLQGSSSIGSSRNTPPPSLLPRDDPCVESASSCTAAVSPPPLVGEASRHSSAAVNPDTTARHSFYSVVDELRDTCAAHPTEMAVTWRRVEHVTPSSGHPVPRSRGGGGSFGKAMMGSGGFSQFVSEYSLSYAAYVKSQRHIYYLGPPQHWSRREWWDMTLDFGYGLRRLGLKPGNKVMIVDHTRWETLLVCYACWALGLVVVFSPPSLACLRQAAIELYEEVKAIVCYRDQRLVQRLRWCWNEAEMLRRDVEHDQTAAQQEQHLLAIELSSPTSYAHPGDRAEEGGVKPFIQRNEVEDKEEMDATRRAGAEDCWREGAGDKTRRRTPIPDNGVPDTEEGGEEMDCLPRAPHGTRNAIEERLFGGPVHSGASLRSSSWTTNGPGQRRRQEEDDIEQRPASVLPSRNPQASATFDSRSSRVNSSQGRRHRSSEDPLFITTDDLITFKQEELAAEEENAAHQNPNGSHVNSYQTENRRQHQRHAAHPPPHSSHPPPVSSSRSSPARAARPVNPRPPHHPLSQSTTPAVKHAADLACDEGDDSQATAAETEESLWWSDVMEHGRQWRCWLQRAAAEWAPRRDAACTEGSGRGSAAWPSSVGEEEHFVTDRCAVSDAFLFSASGAYSENLFSSGGEEPSGRVPRRPTPRRGPRHVPLFSAGGEGGSSGGSTDRARPLGGHVRWSSTASAWRRWETLPVPLQATDLALIFYSSGEPKGVLHTHGALRAALTGYEEQLRRMGQPLRPLPAPGRRNTGTGENTASAPHPSDKPSRAESLPKKEKMGESPEAPPYEQTTEPASCTSSLNPTPQRYENQPTYVAHLPLSHFMTELIMEMVLLHHGFRVCYGSPLTLWDNQTARPRCDVREYRPTLLLGVPVVFHRLCALMEGALTSGGLSRQLFDLSFELRRQALRRGLETPFLNLSAFEQPREMLGGKCTSVMSVGAPLSATILEFLRVVCGVAVHQVYGLKESAACGLLQTFGDDFCCSVGGPLGPVEVQLRAVGRPHGSPSLSYPHASGELMRGELLLRGPTIMVGYHHQVQKTMEVLEPSGATTRTNTEMSEEEEAASGGWWLRTGDIAERCPRDGSFRILGPMKNVFKNTTGIAIGVEALEHLYAQHPLCRPDNVPPGTQNAGLQRLGSTFNAGGGMSGSAAAGWDGVCIIIHPYRSYICALALTNEEECQGFVRRELLPWSAAASVEAPRHRSISGASCANSSANTMTGRMTCRGSGSNSPARAPARTTGNGGSSDVNTPICFAWPQCLRELSFHQAAARSLNRFATERGGVLPHELLRHVRVVHDEWTPNNHLRTSTGRLHRQHIADRYRAIVEEMFEERL